MKLKRRVILAGVFLLAAVLCIMMWNIRFSPTHIAFVNYQAITLGKIAKSNNNSRIKLTALNVDELDKISRYDMVLIDGMGLRITAQQRNLLQRAANKGVAIITTMATNPANEIISTDSVTFATIKGYLEGGGLRNYSNMLTYIRRKIDGKTLDSDEPDAPVKRVQKQFYHADPINPENEDLEFESLADYETFLKRHELYKPYAPRIIITGQMGEPTELVAALERSGNVVYPVHDMQGLVHGGKADSIRPAAVINMAHGRMGKYIEEYLSRCNIPLFAPLNVNRMVSEWESDNMGMNGGFMSQSIVMPEIDGAIRPYVLFGHRTDKDGLQQVYAIEKRLERFVQTVNNYISLQRMPNSKKRVAIYYYKGPGQNALTAAGMEVAPSLYNLLVRMKREGYRIENLPESPAGLSALIQRQGSVFNAYAKGARYDYLKNGNPLLVSKRVYDEWTTKSITPAMMTDVVNTDGEFPGSYISTEDGKLALPRIELGNVVLLPQLAAGKGDDDFTIVHGTNAAPPHAYIASYLWARHRFKADVLVHFGTHGSLEFTPKKQVALSDNDWADALIGAVPHLYIYTIGNVGEGVIAKRRSYAVLQSHLTPPFMESNVRGVYKELCSAIMNYNRLLYADDSAGVCNASIKVKRLAVELGLHRDLRLDSVITTPYSSRDIERIENYAEELTCEKITGELYTMGKAYSPDMIRSSIYAMSTEPIAYSLMALDKLRGRIAADFEKNRSQFANRYIAPSRELVTKLMAGGNLNYDAMVCAVAGITQKELGKARAICREENANHGNGHAHKTAARKMTAGEMSVQKAAGHKMAAGEMPASKKGYTKQEKEFTHAIAEIDRTVHNVAKYKTALERSPEAELASIVNAMNGGYTSPSSGGDPIANPNAIPTGRNLYAVNAEATPSETAWENGKKLADNTIAMYRMRHNDSIPRKVSYTLWSGEFVETEGATIAQILYMLGVEPVRDIFGRVTDIRLIPSRELGRPRIDVVVQTSGQLRDLAASRLFLISRAVEMAAAAAVEDIYENYVAQGVVITEQLLVEKGVSPKTARALSAHRVFGGLNGNYGTGITGMVQSGDRWESTKEIAETYINNMGAFYGSEKDWEQLHKFSFETALANTDAVVQPRQSNTWGVLSLNHVYEFMGGLNLSVRTITGKEPDAYMSDYRNRHNMRMQELKEAIGIESRTTIFNPVYIKEKMKGGAGAAADFAEVIQNTYGWNVMKPDAIDNEIWNNIYDIYIQDRFKLNIKGYFEQQNPAALEEMTAVMMETARKGMWRASTEQLEKTAALHTEMVRKYKASCSGFVCNNAKLREFIASKTSAETAKGYTQEVERARKAPHTNDKGLLLKRDEMNTTNGSAKIIDNTVIALSALFAIAALVLLVRYRRKKMEE